MKKLIRQLDIFGTPVGFVVDQDPYYKTIVGASGTSMIYLFLLLVVFLVLVALLVVNSIDGILQKQNVTVKQLKSTQIRSDNITLNNTNFMFAMKVHNQSTHSFPVLAQQVTVGDVYTQEQVSNFPLVQCQNKHFQKLYSNSQFSKELASIKDLSEWYCPDQNFEILIYRDIDISLSQAYLLSFFINQTDVTMINLDMLYAYSDIQELQSNPLEGHLTSFSYPINTLDNSSVSSDLQYYKWVVATDESVSPISVLTQQVFYLASPAEGQQQYIDQDPNKPYQCFSINISAGRQEITSSRQYEKIQKVISFLGGFIEVMRVGFLLIFSTYNAFDLWLKLSRQFFVMHVHENAIKDDPVEVRQVFKRTKKSGNAFSFKYFAIIYSVEVDEQVDKRKKFMPQMRKDAIKKKVLSLQEFQSKLSSILEQTKIMVPKFRNYIAGVCCLFSSKFAKQRIIFQTAINIISEDLDIFRYIQALSDVEKLKRLLLNDEQRQLFDFKKKQDVFIQRNKQGEIIVNKGFTLEHQDKAKKIVEPNPMDPIHMQLSTYEEVWKILIKLRNQQEKQDTLVYKINHGLTQFLRQDVKDLFEEMLDQNDKQAFVQRYKKKKTMDLGRERSDFKRKSFDNSKNETLQDNVLDLSMNNKEPMQPLLSQTKIEFEIEMSKIPPLMEKISQLNNEQIVSSRSYQKTATINKSFQKSNRQIIIEQESIVDLMQIFQEDLELVYLKDVVRVSYRSSVEWEEDQDNQPFGLLNCFIKLENKSKDSLAACSFTYEARYLMKFEQEEIIDHDEKYRKLYDQDCIPTGQSVELSSVYQIIPVESILNLDDAQDITKLTLEDIFSLTNQHIIIMFSVRGQSYKVILRLHNSIMKNWITQRPNTDVLMSEANLFREEVYFNIGKGERDNFLHLKEIFNQEFIIDKKTLIDEVKKANLDQENSFDLEQHFEEQATLENVMFVMMLNPKLLDILASQCVAQNIPSLWTDSILSQREHIDLLRREYQCFIEIQYNKNQTTSLFYLCTQTQPNDNKTSHNYYLERQTIIHITYLAMASYYQNTYPT